MEKQTEVILTPKAFNAQISLVLITAVYIEQQRKNNPYTYKEVLKEVRDLIYAINMTNPVRKPVSKILRFEVINRENDFNITIGQLDPESNKTILITKQNENLLFGWMRHGMKPQSLAEWRRIFGL